MMNALRRLSRIALDEGDEASLEALLREGSTLALELGDKFQLVIFLVRWGSLWLARGQAERAARLLAWAEAARASAGFQYSALRQADWERVETAVRAQLAEDVGETLWAEGRAMTMEQAVAYALEGTHDGG